MNGIICIIIFTQSLMLRNSKDTGYFYLSLGLDISFLTSKMRGEKASQSLELPRTRFYFNQ